MSTAGILLAAGMSHRMGRPKMLLPWRDQPLVRHMAQLALAVPLDPVVVVTGFAAAEVNGAIRDLHVCVVHNSHYDLGQSTSLIAGLSALGPDVDAALILLVDQPLLEPDVLRLLLATHTTHPEAIIAPTYEGRRGNPVIIPRAFWPDLFRIKGDTGARDVLRAAGESVKLVAVASPAVIDDADTPEAYTALLKRAPR